MRLLRILVRRVLHAIPVLLLVSLGAFGLLYLIPGDPAYTLAGGENSTPESIAAVRKEFNLDDPFFQQFGRWLWNAIHFDFGRSLQNNLPVRTQILQRIPETLSIATGAILIATVVGLLLGIISGTRAGTVVDRLISAISVGAIAIPSFVLAILLVRVFAIELEWLPAVSYVPLSESAVGWLKSIILPSIALSALGVGGLSRQLRSSLVGTLRSDFVRTTWTLGGSRWQAVGKHALRNAAGPAVATLGASLAFLIGGTVIIEQIFAINGVGSLMFSAATTADLPLLRGLMIWFALVQLAAYLLTDIALVLLNPRIEVG
ncbi:MAG TPA: ABC transporter permease [Ilumatobacteraceae bacterium]|nr:ABC transporter permease [Ilumatobacteraceae bacterium]